jgi:hypothetical protein
VLLCSLAIRYLFLVVALVAAQAGIAVAQTVPPVSRNEGGEPEPIVTDRPDFTEAAVVVGKRRFQIESGFTSERRRSGRSLGLPEVLMRYGVSERWEVRFAPANYNQLRSDDGETVSGFGDT